uniref:Ral transcription factor IIIC subunit 5 n=1 Tax=Oncorhynchus mykiss TaxID=8022 RepID=A0A8C7SJT3_ONCMY
MAASGLDDLNFTMKAITGTRSEDNRLVCVEYPGIISNVDNMLETIGGIQGVSKTYADPSRRLELRFRFRSKDPFCHPAFGNRFPSTNLNLQSTWTSWMSLGQHTNSKVQLPKHKHLTPLYHWMADFQYLAVHSAKDGSHTSLYNKILLRKPENNEFFEQPVPLFIPPPIFSRLDSAVDYSYQPEIQHKEGYCPPTVSRNNLIGLSRARRPHNAIFLNFDDKNVPRSPWRLPKAKKHQVLDFRIRCSTKHVYTINDMPVKAKRSTFNYTLPITLNKASKLLMLQIYNKTSHANCRLPCLLFVQESSYLFQDGTLPPHRQMFYHLCDLDVQRNDGQEEECDERDGWCLSHTSDDLRDIMSSMIKQVIRAKRPGFKHKDIKLYFFVKNQHQVGHNHEVERDLLDISNFFNKSKTEKLGVQNYSAPLS